MYYSECLLYVRFYPNLVNVNLTVQCPAVIIVLHYISGLF